MYKAIKDIIFKEDLVNIFTKISKNFLDIYASAFAEINLENKTGAQR
jgi:hypothetical protein